MFICYGKKFVPLQPWQKTYSPEQVSFNPMNLLKSPAYPHLWFMYMLIALYLAIPILRAIYKSPSLQLKIYTFSLLLILPLLSFIKDLSGFVLSPNFELNFFSTCTVYLIYGYYSLNPPEFYQKLTLKKSLLLVMIGYIITWGLSNVWQPSATIFQNIISPSLMLTTIGLFDSVLKIKISEKWLRFIKSVSDCSFGIYFLHFIPLYYIATIRLDGKNLFMMWHSALSIPIALFMCFSISYAVIFTIRHIPILRKAV